MPHNLSSEEWLSQAHRDLRAATHLLSGNFHAHAAVCAQLAVEKALKAAYKAATGANAPVSHDVRYLASQWLPHVSAAGWTSDHQDALDALADVTIVSLYQPDRPFGHPVSNAPARDRVGHARLLVGWIEGTMTEPAADGGAD